MSEKGLAQVTAAILAGGLGTRLRTVVADRPKVLARINGRPFLSYLLDQLVDTGIKKVVLCTGYMGQQIEAEFGVTYGSLQLAYSPEPGPLGTAGALRLAVPLFNTDTVLVLNGDSFCRADLVTFYNWHQTHTVAGSLLLVHVPDTSRYGSVQIAEDSRIVSFKEKNETGGPGWISAGIYLLHRTLLESIPAERAVSIEQEMFPAWLEQGLYGYQSEGAFLDIGTPEAYQVAEQFLAQFKNEPTTSMRTDEAYPLRPAEMTIPSEEY